MASPVTTDQLPGADLIDQGLADFKSRLITVESLLVSIASPRLRACGLLNCRDSDIPADAELQLYRLLSLSPGEPYPRYNSLLRQLISFEHALDHRITLASWQVSPLRSGTASAL